MSRIYLVCFLLCCYQYSFSQTKEELIEFANKQKNEQDYLSALVYFEKALAIDSESVHLLWDYAEALRLHKNYAKAEAVYKKVYEKEETLLHTKSLYYWGEMLKYNGKYEEAIEVFKLAKKKYAKNDDGYIYNKTKQEFESCLWASKAKKDSLDVNLENGSLTLNSRDSEFGHTLLDEKFYFSALKADSISPDEIVFSDNYKNGIYSYDIKTNTIEAIKTLNSRKHHVGNGTFSLDKSRFYYSVCKDSEAGLRCKIMVSRVKAGQFEEPDTLGEIINEVGANTTMPFISLFEGNEVLFFASDREGTKGGLDIFYSIITQGNRYSKPLAIEAINTQDNELSPFYDDVNKQLYFSSSWYYGFGGYDIFKSTYVANNFSKPENLGLPINSSANDMYYFQHKDTAYLSSNRIGVKFSSSPTCCSDVYKVTKANTPNDELSATNSTKQGGKSAFDRLNKKLPVTLYFHNDIPNPKSLDTTSNVNYLDSYDDYILRIPQYKREYSKGLKGDKVLEAEEDIESFFIEYVKQGVKDLAVFKDLLYEELAKGRSLMLTVKGFASPLAKTDYNVNLTKRRIASFINYLAQVDEGKFLPFLENTHPSGTRLQIQQVPFGEYTANQNISDNPNDLKNSIFSRYAALERKIEVQSVTFLKNEVVNYLVVKEQVKNLGKIKANAIQTVEFEVSNSGKELLTIEKIDIPCECNQASIAQKTLKPGEKTKVKMTLDPKGYSGNVVKSVYIHVKNTKDPLRLVMTAEVE